MRLFLPVLLGCFCLAAPAFSATRENARELLKKSDYLNAVEDYSDLSHGSLEPALFAEYAYALALLGFADPALAQLDRAFLLDARNPDVLYFASEIFAALGQMEAAYDLGSPEPQWLWYSELKLAPLSPERPRANMQSETAAVNLLIAQGRYITASDRLARLITEYPKVAAFRAGYAVALEELGAYRTAAASIAKERELSGAGNASAEKIKAEHQAELEALTSLRAQHPVRQENEAVSYKGRMLLFLGGSYSHASGGALYNINARAGRFITEHLDVSATAGYTKGNGGGNYGLSLRQGIPLWYGAPLELTAASIVSYSPAAGDNFSAVVSPGISVFIGPGSVDVSLDIGVEGPLKNTKTLSAGYTTYFGGGKK